MWGLRLANLWVVYNMFVYLMLEFHHIKKNFLAPPVMQIEVVYISFAHHMVACLIKSPTVNDLIFKSVMFNDLLDRINLVFVVHIF